MDDSESVLFGNEIVDYYSPEGGMGQDATGFSARTQKDNFLGGSSKDNIASSEMKLSEIKRPYTTSDVQSTQQNLKAFQEMRQRDNTKYKLGVSNWYQLLSTGAFSSGALPEDIKNTPKEVFTNPHDYEELLLDVYKVWRQNLITNKDYVFRAKPNVGRSLGKHFESPEQLPTPTTAAELRALYEKYPELNDFSAVSYQDGFQDGAMNSPFLHFQGHRMSGYRYERPETQMRLYLNPPKEALPLIARQVIRLADRDQVPFYFKMVDFSLKQRFTREDERRMDRMIFYTDQHNSGKIADILSKIRIDHPEWFPERPLPPLTAKVLDGVGVAEDPSEYQDKNFASTTEKKTSFNYVRAQFLQEVWIDTTKEAILRNPDIRPRGNRTFREIFRDHVPVVDKPYVDHIWASGFNPDVLNDKAKKVMEDALHETMIDVIPNIRPDTLLPYVNHAISQKARKYDIDPNNLALNGHYYDKAA